MDYALMDTMNFAPIDLTELCEATELPTDIVIEIVEQGIVDPAGDCPQNRVFNAQMIYVTKKAIRLYRDLDIDWPENALAISLIDEIDMLREENSSATFAPVC
jgi:chaperone modulatory protein CbpM